MGLWQCRPLLPSPVPCQEISSPASTHAHPHAHTHAHTHERSHVCTHTHAHSHMRVHTRTAITGTHTCTRVCAHARSHICTRTHTCMCAHSHRCMHIHAHRCTHMHTRVRAHTKLCSNRSRGLCTFSSLFTFLTPCFPSMFSPRLRLPLNFLWEVFPDPEEKICVPHRLQDYTVTA